MLVKDVVDRARPALGDPAALVALPPTPSFPSGHASTAFAGAIAVLVWSRRLGVLALAVAAVVAFSRVYLGVHYPSDVLAGALLGGAVGYLAARAVQAGSRRLALRARAAARPPAPGPASRGRPADAAAAAPPPRAGRRP
jgi:undecaprenyl-diphosphatase